MDSGLNEASPDTAEHAQNSENGHHDYNEENIKTAAARLAQEANQTLTFGVRDLKDVTQEFVKASKALKPGQLVKDDFFTLFEAVGALEIMDPKMDSGVIPPGEPVEPTFDPSAPLSPGQILWIMDELFCLEHAWLEGYPLSQTVFASLHIDRLLDPANRFPYTFLYGEQPELDDDNVEMSLTHRILRAYCIAVVKSVQMVLQLVQSQNYYEEEDFVTHLFGRELCPKIPLDESGANDVLEEAINWLHHASVPQNLKDALQARLQARSSYLQTMFGDEDCWETMTALVQGPVANTHDLCVPVPEAITDKVQRHLATSTPPRPVLETSWSKSIASWAKTSADIMEAVRLTSFWVRQSPSCLQRATWAFASRQPGTYPRAIFQDLLFADGKVAGDTSHYDLLLLDIHDLVLPGDSVTDRDSFQIELPSDPRHQVSRLIEGFMDKAFEEYLNLYRMVCQNSCRIRRTFTQAIPLLHELETTIAANVDREVDVILKRERLDTALGKKVFLSPLTTWARYYKLKIMTETIQLGFETEIYLQDEVAQMYWYLSYLATESRKVIDHIVTHTRDRLSRLSRMRDMRYVAECTTSLDWLERLKMQLNITISLASALHTLHALLAHLGLIPSPERPFAQTLLQYEARLKPYCAVHDPALPGVDKFTASGQLSQPVEAACESVDMDLKAARTQLADLKKVSPQSGKYIGTEERWKSEIKQLETSCVAASVAVSLIKRSWEKHSFEPGAQLKIVLEATLPAAGKRYHDWWVVPQVKQKK